MNFTALLSQIKSGGQTSKSGTRSESKPVARSTNTIKRTASAPAATNRGISVKNAHKAAKAPLVMDPAVARLKAARQAEREAQERKKQEEKRQRLIAAGMDPDGVKKSVKSAKKPSLGSSSKENSRSRKTISHGKAGSKASFSNTESPEPLKKKWKFTELMKEAAKNDGKSLKINIKSKNTPEAKKTGTDSRKDVTEVKKSSIEIKKGIARRSSPDVMSGTNTTLSNKPKNRQNPEIPSVGVRGSRVASKRLPAPVQANPAPLRLAGPSEKLRQKLESKRKLKERSIKRKQRGYDDYDDDEEEDDDFIVYDDEEEEQEREKEPGYDRDEIWAMFNKGKRRRYQYDDYDDDESDMEATGLDVLEEEEISARQAALEEKREKELEKRLLREKQERLKRLKR